MPQFVNMKIRTATSDNWFAAGPIIWLRRWEGSDEAETTAD